MADIRIAKAALRKQITSMIISTESIVKQSQYVIKQVLDNSHVQQASSISVYCSMPGELDTDPLFPALFAANKKVFVPRFDVKQSVRTILKMQMVRLTDVNDWRNLPTYKWGIRQPALDQVLEDALDNDGVDVVLLPGVAFTKSGHRLGHGKGYYDTFLAEHNTRMGRLPYMIGLALNHQIVDSLPMTDTDIVLDQVLAEFTHN